MTALGWLPLLLLVGLPADGLGDEVAVQEPSPWYLERGTARRTAGPLDDLPTVVEDLAALLRDGRVPGFYDGQFAATAGRFQELVRVAQDRDLHHTIRIMAVMALQEAADGEALHLALDPLLLDPGVEHQIEWEEAGRVWRREAPGPMEDDVVRRELDADLSRHARFALAKDGQPAAILERIAVLRQFVDRRRVDILDPAIETLSSFQAWYGRQLWFDIAYHYQQFDDYETASWWFRQLCDSLPAGGDTRMAHYNLACMAALEGRPELALTELRRAYEAGFLDVTWMDEDGDLASLRALPEYEALRQAMLGEAPGPPDPAAAPERDAPLPTPGTQP